MRPGHANHRQGDPARFSDFPRRVVLFSRGHHCQGQGLAREALDRANELPRLSASGRRDAAPTKVLLLERLPHLQGGGLGPNEGHQDRENQLGQNVLEIIAATGPDLVEDQGRSPTNG